MKILDGEGTFGIQTPDPVIRGFFPVRHEKDVEFVVHHDRRSGIPHRTIEGLQRTIFAGSIHALAEIDVKFTKPLVLPAKVGLYIRGDEVWVGDAPGGPAYLAGHFVRTTPAVATASESTP